tara:strand:- start:3713 stop:4543 length:831 start_codon:yes stop_codon:yes gene_type:complete
MKLLKFMWRKIFIFLQVNIPLNHRSRILRFLDKLSIIYHDLYENKNYNINFNGEKYLIKKLYENNYLDCIFDIGANKGEYSILSRKISQKAKIFAFEPVLETYQSLKYNVKDMRVNTYNFAFGSFSGSSNINLYSEDTLSSMVNFQGDFLNKEVRKVEIRINTGNQFLEDNHNIKEISLLKIDTEGFENKVLEGFKNYLQIINVIQFEYGMANLSSKYFLYDYFKDYSNIFAIGKLYPRGVVFYKKYDVNLENFIGPNFIMVRKQRIDLIEILKYK